MWRKVQSKSCTAVTSLPWWFVSLESCIMYLLFINKLSVGVFIGHFWSAVVGRTHVQMCCSCMCSLTLAPLHSSSRSLCFQTRTSCCSVLRTHNWTPIPSWVTSPERCQSRGRRFCTAREMMLETMCRLSTRDFTVAECFQWKWLNVVD